MSRHAAQAPALRATEITGGSARLVKHTRPGIPRSWEPRHGRIPGRTGSRVRKSCDRCPRKITRKISCKVAAAEPVRKPLAAPSAERYTAGVKSTVDILGEALEDLSGRGLLIGGLALQQYAVARQTLDVDCLICDADRDRIVGLFKKEGFAVTAETGSFVRLRHESVHMMDVMMDLDLLLVDAETLSEMLAESRPAGIGSRGLRVPCLAHLIALKLHSVRNDPKRELRDLSDIVELLRANPDVVTAEELERLTGGYGPDGALEKIRTQL